MAEHIEYGTTGKPHPYHLVRPSIWPIAISFLAGFAALCTAMYMHDVKLGTFTPGLKGVAIGLIGVVTIMALWWKDILFETVKETVHNGVTEVGLRMGMALFIASEVMFFVAFFWAFFDVSLYPAETHQYLRAVYTGGAWPPVGIETIPAFDLPFMMTMILLLSGCTVTWAHHAILHGNNKDAIMGLGISVALGFFFLCFQMYEYHHASFAFKQGVFASTFYMATGFHGFHVFVGTVFLFVCWRRSLKGQFTVQKHFGFEAAAWYWHFVDVVWLFLFVAVYWWGSVPSLHS